MVKIKFNLPNLNGICDECQNKEECPYVGHPEDEIINALNDCGIDLRQKMGVLARLYLTNMVELEPSNPIYIMQELMHSDNGAIFEKVESGPILSEPITKLTALRDEYRVKGQLGFRRPQA